MFWLTCQSPNYRWCRSDNAISCAKLGTKTSIQKCQFNMPTSGVSAGHIIPQSVLCSCRGLASFPSLPIGEFNRLKWDKVDAKVSLFNTWDTPALAWWAFFWSPQFPVANEYRSPSVMIFVLMANSILKSCQK